MHSKFYNEAIFHITLRPQGPLLIKSGSEGGASVNPTLPDMNFVRTYRPDLGEVVYIPGSSLRGVLRSHAEKLVRSVNLDEACDPFLRANDENEYGLKPACLRGKDKSEGKEKIDGVRAYRESCYICRIFGNMEVAGRLKINDFYPLNGNPTTEVRYGVAIDRVTGSVAHGPFDMEVVTDGEFSGTITLRNFTLGQLGLVGAALCDMADGFVRLGYGKARGLGQVDFIFEKLEIRYLRKKEKAARSIISEILSEVVGENNKVYGIETLCDANTAKEFALPPAREGLELPGWSASPSGSFILLTGDEDGTRKLLEAAAPLWVEEVQR